MILALLLVLGGPVQHQALVVGAGAIPSLARALELAHPGDTILVGPGLYHEPTLMVDRRVTILGHDWPVVDGSGDHDLFQVHADSVEIRGLVIQHVGFSTIEDRAGIKATGVTGCRIVGNRLVDAAFAIYLAKSTNCLIADNRIDGQGQGEALSGNGIHLWSSHHITVERNVIRGQRDGIYLEFTTDSRLTGNLSTGNVRYGLHFMFSHDCEYRDNRFDGNGDGVAVMYSHGVTMMGNQFTDNRGSAAYGLLLKELSDSRVDGNLFAGNTIGLFLEGTNRIEFSNNRFDRNGWAVILLGDAFANQFQRNSFTGNSFDVATNSVRTQSSFRGNYWDHYSGYDLDRDGIGDVPYAPVRLFALVVQRHSPALLLLRSLFVDLLDIAERVLPVLTPAGLVDQAPLMRRPS
ncbi:MAG: nitrous oxide reductase family maturation protein NosD [Gemmatimonadota bacterium]